MSIPKQYFFFLTFFWFSLSGQYSSNVDSLTLALTENTTTLDSAYTKIQLANYYIYHNLDTASTYINEVLDGAEKKHFVLPDTFYILL